MLTQFLSHLKKNCHFILKSVGGKFLRPGNVFKTRDSPFNKGIGEVS